MLSPEGGNNGLAGLLKLSSWRICRNVQRKKKVFLTKTARSQRAPGEAVRRESERLPDHVCAARGCDVPLRRQ